MAHIRNGLASVPNCRQQTSCCVLSGAYSRQAGTESSGLCTPSPLQALLLTVTASFSCGTDCSDIRLACAGTRFGGERRHNCGTALAQTSVRKRHYMHITRTTGSLDRCFAPFSCRELATQRVAHANKEWRGTSPFPCQAPWTSTSDATLLLPLRAVATATFVAQVVLLERASPCPPMRNYCAAPTCRCALIGLCRSIRCCRESAAALVNTTTTRGKTIARQT